MLAEEWVWRYVFGSSVCEGSRGEVWGGGEGESLGLVGSGDWDEVEEGWRTGASLSNAF